MCATEAPKGTRRNVCGVSDRSASANGPFYTVPACRPHKIDPDEARTCICLKNPLQWGPWVKKELLGHKDVRTTMIYTHVLNHGGRGVRSPADLLQKAPP